ncbi:solute carrier family 52, riboflavin transporter, member 2 [Bombina bombina]|uniref:solute carrier family 52, riboflavin transporter, member 2 n=1 Tax=Bombina bombina TaxID=8345 RepID=UPI00235A697C|nr:solute carrier family 52, riboflavin transporter, member 2 [Bombina bombina]
MASFVHFLSCLLGLGSWVAINGVWVELPLLVPQAPEGWELPSYLTLLIQFANVGPLVVTVIHKLRPGTLSEKLVIFLLLGVGVMACVLLAFLWKETSWVGTSLRSTALLVLIFFLALVDCTSSVTFLPYMTRLHPDYLTSYFIGEGLSGLMPALLALGQGVGVVSCVPLNITESNGTRVNDTLAVQYHPARFPVWVFFMFLAGMMGTCLLAFTILNRMSSESCQRKRLSEGPCRNVAEPKPVIGEEENRQKCSKAMGRPVMYSWGNKLFIFLVLAWVNALTNSVLPAVQTYSCMPYGGHIYHLAVSLAAMANPLACGIAMYFPDRSLCKMGILTASGTGIGCYIMSMAIRSPCPPLMHAHTGGILIVLGWVLFVGVLSYVKVIIGVILRDEGHSALVWCGAVVQLGSMLGALTMFPLVNIYTVFVSGETCVNSCPL